MKKRVLVWMSWWVDSAVTAHLLIQQWYEVIAWFMKNYADESNPDCHTRQDRDMALKVSQYLGIQTFVIFDFRKQYHEQIISYIYDTYKQWLTPNPDILCNTLVKFKLFLDEWIKLGCDYVATGHYARIKKLEDGSTQLLKWIDQKKDQSYFLSWLHQHQLKKSLFPLWDIEKSEVREIARAAWLPNAERKDSQWLCFIGKVSMKDFLMDALPKTPWNIVDTKGNILWAHDGVWFYTIGQRQWLGLAWWPWYVMHRDVEKNILTVWPETAEWLIRQELQVKERHRISWTAPQFPLTTWAKIRYRQTDQECTIHPKKDNFYTVTFASWQRAISAWQTIALYNHDVLVWSWIIC